MTSNEPAGSKQNRDVAPPGAEDVCPGKRPFSTRMQLVVAIVIGLILVPVLLPNPMTWIKSLFHIVAYIGMMGMVISATAIVVSLVTIVVSLATGRPLREKRPKGSSDEWHWTTGKIVFLIVLLILAFCYVLFRTGLIS